MADYDVNLSQLHWRVWQEEIGLAGTISEYGHVMFGHDGVGVVTVFIAKASPGKVTVNYRFIEDYFDNDLTTEKTLEICNSVNVFGGTCATLVAEGGSVDANVHLLLPVTDTNGTGLLPDEGFLRAVIGPAISEIKAAAEKFTSELKKDQ
jgi:hypothetical protein